MAAHRLSTVRITTVMRSNIADVFIRLNLFEKKKQRPDLKVSFCFFVIIFSSKASPLGLAVSFLALLQAIFCISTTF